MKDRQNHSLTVSDATVLVVGLVIGAGIFRTPSLVAANSGSYEFFIIAWILGGVISLIGALCYAELSTTYPNTGGDYYFLRKAYGENMGFLFAWARLSVIQTGSIALLAYIFGDYFSSIFNIGEYSSVIYAGSLVVLLTAINIAGIKFGSLTQKVFTGLEVGGILFIIIMGLFFAPDTIEPVALTNNSSSDNASLGLAMVFVLLTFGGWNEAAYISAEVRSGRNAIVKALVWGLIIITLLYLFVNIAFLNVLGISRMGSSDTVVSDFMEIVAGVSGAKIVSVIIAVSALTSVNATIFTGARSNFALGRDFRALSFLGKWNERTAAPVNAFLVQGIISLLLISLGLFTRKGFETMVDYTAPIFWFFFLLAGISLFVLRNKDTYVKRPFSVPLYPITPIIFCLTSGYLLYSSVMYTGIGALVGIIMLSIGGVVLYFIKREGNIGGNNSEHANEKNKQNYISKG